MLNEQEMERSKALLDDFYALSSTIESMAVADALAAMTNVAENLVDFIVDIRHPE